MATPDSDSKGVDSSRPINPEANRYPPEADASEIRISKREVLSAAFRFQGPLPPPQMLREYEDVFSGCADRIVAMAERQSAHRQAMEKVALRQRTRRSVWGKYLHSLSRRGGNSRGHMAHLHRQRCQWPYGDYRCHRCLGRSLPVREAHAKQRIASEASATLRARVFQ